MINRTAMRMLDANFNRAREALRTVEDYCRFVLNDQDLSGVCKTLRHELCVQMTSLGADDAVLYRDTPGDVGVTTKAEDELRRGTPEQIVMAGARRLTEALRVLEELAKLTSAAAAVSIESLRYRFYSAEQAMLRQAAQRNKLPRVGLHVLLTESLCRRPWRETLAAILEGGADVVQLREKGLSDGELLIRARVVAEACRKYGRLSIVNDRTDIALAAEASGVHLGQEDMPCEQARKLAGSGLMIGVSTENIEQARAAKRAGATYIGAGPMFPTTTKEKPRLAGIAYIRELIAAEISLPIVAIGGITPGNLPELMAAGAYGVAASSAVVSADDPAAICRQLRELLTAGSQSAATSTPVAPKAPAPTHGAGHE